MLKIKKMAIMLLSLILAATMAACSSGTAPTTDVAPAPADSAPAQQSADSAPAAEAPQVQDITLTYIIDRDTDQTAPKAVMARFTELTGIKFEEELRPGGAEGETLLRTRFATGDAPDFIWFNAGSLLTTLDPGKNFVDLTGQPFLDRLQDSYIQTVTFDGKVVGVPGRTSMAGGWLYNKAAYAELGLNVPTTWAELMANCEAIKASGKTAVIGSYQDSWTAQLLLLADFHNLQVQVPNFAADFDANKAKFATTPQALRAFEKLAEVYEKGYLNKDFLATTYDLALEMLVNGDGVHYPMLTFALSAIESNFGAEATENIGFFAQPADSAEHTGLTLWMPDGWYACSGSPNTDAVIQFFDFSLSEEGQSILFAHNRGEGPSVVTGAKLPDNAFAAVRDMMQYFDSGKTAPALEFISAVKGPNTPQICVEVGTGVVTPAEGAAALDADVELSAKQLGLAGW